jgi:hypothetical protein
MGDMADMALDHAFNVWLEDGDEIYIPQQSRNNCKYCLEGGFHWELTPNGWRLFDEYDEMHTCRTKKTTSPTKPQKPTQKPKPRRSIMGLFTRKPAYLSDRGDLFQVDEMEPTHLLNAIAHHRKQMQTLDHILEHAKKGQNMDNINRRRRS